MFDNSEGTCLFNQSFGSGNKSVKLANGTYRFVTLSGIEGFDLPAGGTTDDISLSTPIALKAGSKCSPVQVSAPQKVSIPGTSVYTADLKPATCLLKPELKNVPEGVTLALTNMYNVVSLTGSYTGAEAVCPPYSLGSGENICLPTMEMQCCNIPPEPANLFRFRVRSTWACRSKQATPIRLPCNGTTAACA